MPVANQMYKEHLVIWTVVHDKQTDCWTPTAKISWQVKNKYEFKRIYGPPQTSQPKALALAEQIALAWVDKRVAQKRALASAH
jgi:hypothetical protein